MRKMWVIGAAIVALTSASLGASAQERAVTGAAIGAGTGAVIAGPPGAVVGAVVGGPRLSRHYDRRVCWYDHRGFRHCNWR